MASDAQLTAFESERNARIARNREVMLNLGVEEAYKIAFPSSNKEGKKSNAKKKARPNPEYGAGRRSSRIHARTKHEPQRRSSRVQRSPLLSMGSPQSKKEKADLVRRVPKIALPSPDASASDDRLCVSKHVALTDLGFKENDEKFQLHQHNLQRLRSMTIRGMKNRIGKITNIEKLQSLVLILRKLNLRQLRLRVQEALQLLLQANPPS